MYDRFKRNRICAWLVRASEKILNRAMRVLFAYLCVVRIGLLCMDSMRVCMQLQQQGIRHHYSNKEQEQQQSDMSQKTIHLIGYN